jgi:hypothetical protein
MVRAFSWPLPSNKEENMRDFKTIGIRLNRSEALAVKTLADTEEITVSELVRRWILMALLHQMKASPFTKAS